MVERRKNIKIGCCGFALPQAKYFTTFPCIEIDTSFYQLPRIETATRWRAEAPAEFQFAMKAWQVITHPSDSPTYKRTRLPDGDRPYCGRFGFSPTVRWAWDETSAIATALRAVLVLFQCPASFRPTKENIASLRRFFERAKRGKFYMGWEPRGEWPTEVVAELCDELDLIHVVDPLKNPPACTGKIRYYRLQGTTGFRHHYSNKELHQLQGLCAGSTPTYCMFNNIRMAADAQKFAQLF